MISPFTPDELDLVSMLLRSRYLADTPIEEIEAEVQPDPAQPAPHAPSPAPVTWILADLRELRFDIRNLACPLAAPISTQPTREVHHPEGLFVAHWGD